MVKEEASPTKPVSFNLKPTVQRKEVARTTTTKRVISLGNLGQLITDTDKKALPLQG